MKPRNSPHTVHLSQVRGNIRTKKILFQRFIAQIKIGRQVPHQPKQNKRNKL